MPHTLPGRGERKHRALVSASQDARTCLPWQSHQVTEGHRASRVCTPPSSSGSRAAPALGALSEPKSIVLPRARGHDCRPDGHKVQPQNGRTLLPAPGTSPARGELEQGPGWAGRAAVVDARGSAFPHQWCLPSEERGRKGRVRSIRGVCFPFTCPYGCGGSEAGADTRSKWNTSIRTDFSQPGKGLRVLPQ